MFYIHSISSDTTKAETEVKYKIDQMFENTQKMSNCRGEFGHFCAACYAVVTDAGQRATLAGEAHEWHDKLTISPPVVNCYYILQTDGVPCIFQI